MNRSLSEYKSDNINCLWFCTFTFFKIKNVKFPPNHVVTLSALELLGMGKRSIKYCLTS